MKPQTDRIGVTREHRWFKVPEQIRRLEAAGCCAILQLGKNGATMLDVVKMATAGRTFVFVRAFLAADPRHKHQRGGLMQSFDKTHTAITKRGGEIEDLDAGVGSKQLRALRAVVKDDIARSNQGAKSALNGKLSKGRPRAKFTDDQIEKAYNIWHNLKRYPQWDDAKAALAEIVSDKGEPFTAERAYAKWKGRK